MAWNANTWYLPYDGLYLATSPAAWIRLPDRGKQEAVPIWRHHGNANPTAVQHSVIRASSGPFYINRAQNFCRLDKRRAICSTAVADGGSGLLLAMRTKETGVRTVLPFHTPPVTACTLRRHGENLKAK